ncbi:MAG TPA: DUF2997 domain-containing protein [Spirochaetota bacterium]|nr:DUF2997 domain-containing protein [Spirochaetota bacterium]
MAVEKIRIVIEKNGDIKVDLDGFKGKSCEEIINFLEKSIGPAKRKNKPEYDQNIRITHSHEEKVKA